MFHVKRYSNFIIGVIVNLSIYTDGDIMYLWMVQNIMMVQNYYH